MSNDLNVKLRMIILFVYLMALTIGFPIEFQAMPASMHSQGATSHPSERSLPAAFVPVLPEVKAKSGIPVLLPSELFGSLAKAKYAVIQKGAANEYAISLYYELGVGDAGFAALFAAQAKPNYDPRELSDSEVKLARGMIGYFRPVSCGGSCAPANIWWQNHGTLYQVQIKLPSTLSEQAQKMAIKSVADSAIIGGPR